MLTNFFRKWKKKLDKKLYEKQFLPTKEDINNKEIKNLVKRIKGNSDSETLNNILEWQDKNIRFWHERYIMGTFLLSFYLLFLIFVVVSIYFPLPINWFIFGISLFIGIFIGIMICMLILYWYWPDFRGTPFFGRIKKVFKMIKNQLSISLTVQDVLEYRLAVCRDYAKLTAALLLNLYPKNKIYFLLIPRHVATAIEIENRMYILDQKMHILQHDAWLKRWNKTEADLWEMKGDIDSLNIEFVKTIELGNKLNNKLKKWDEVLKDMVNGLEKAINENKENFEYTFKGYSKLYNLDDPIIKESMKRTINNKIKSEFLSNFSKIRELRINKKGEDLILKIDLNEEKK